MKYFANLTTMFQEEDFYNRFYKAVEHGFDTVEVLFPYDYDIEKIKSILAETGLKMIGMDFVPGDFYKGEIGMLNNPNKIENYKLGVEKTIECALKLGVKKINCLVGCQLKDVSLEKQYDTIIDNLRYTAREAANHGITVLIEPINSKDKTGYLCDSCEKALQLIKDVGEDNVKLLFDVYHIYRMGADVISEYHTYYEWIDHLHISDSPGRTEPGLGEIDFNQILPEIEKSYKGLIGLEYTNRESVFGTLIV